MTEARHEEVLDHGFGSRGARDDVPEVIEMGPVHDDIEVDDIEVIEMGPAAEEASSLAPPPPPRAFADTEVPPVDAWEQTLNADPDAPPPPSPRRSVADQEVPEADAWEQAIPTDRFDDY
jgi:hypothetical protein